MNHSTTDLGILNLYPVASWNGVLHLSLIRSHEVTA